MNDQSIIGTEFVSDLNQNTSFDPDESIFRGIWKEYERVVLHSIVITFGLDGFIHNFKGGDVDTVKTVQESAQFKNARWKEKYEQRGAYDTKAYHTDAIPEGCTILCTENSYAYQWAQEHGFDTSSS